MEKENNSSSSNHGGGGRDQQKQPSKVKLMCSYGGRIQSRSHDHQLTYAGGDTKILTVDRCIKLNDIVAKLNSLCNFTARFCLKYQLPGEDLDSLVSLIDDDDVEHMMVEYDRIHRISDKPARLRLFVFPAERLAGEELRVGYATPPLVQSAIPDFLFGFDKDYEIHTGTYTTPVSEIPEALPTVIQSGPKDGAGNPTLTKNHGVAGQDGYPLSSYVTSGGSYAYPSAPMFYRVPVAAGADQVGLAQYGGGGGMMMMQRVPIVSNREQQPVYSLISVMPSPVQGANVAINYSNGVAANGAGGGGGGGRPMNHPSDATVTMAAGANDNNVESRT